MATPPPPKIGIDPSSPRHKSIDEAAYGLHTQVGKADRHGEQETAGVILKTPDGSYQYSTLAPQALHDKFEIHVMIPDGTTIAGIYHTHPGDDDDAKYFSQDDLNIARKLNVPSYITFSDGSLRKYQPGQTKTDYTTAPGSRNTQKTAIGDVVPAPAPPTAEQKPVQDLFAPVAANNNIANSFRAAGQ